MDASSLLASIWLLGRRSRADHACSPYELVHRCSAEPLDHEGRAHRSETKVALENARDREQAFNRWTSSNLKLQIADREYASRASANSGHFLIPRTSNELYDYLARVVEPNMEPNTLGLYAYYHLAAVALARRWGTAEAQGRPELARTILATEAFALHFLEDMLAAGHVAGSWGKVAERKGTHDYYSEFGLDTASWNGARFTALGDAHLRDQDLKPNAAIVMASLSPQVFEAATDRPTSIAATLSARVPPLAAYEAGAFDSCTATHQPSATVIPGTMDAGDPDAMRTPIPGLGAADVYLPRFRQEIGPFLGFAGDLSGCISSGASSRSAEICLDLTDPQRSAFSSAWDSNRLPDRPGPGRSTSASVCITQPHNSSASLPRPARLARPKCLHAVA